MQITSVDFLITFRCNANCKHCGYRAGPSNHGYMKVDDAKKWLSTLASAHPLQSITIHGGEPLLFFPNYCLERILRYATELNIPKRGIITNGFWATDKETARRKLTKLKSCGLTNITFSVDGFHQEHIPIETVRICIEEAVALGFTKVGILSHYLISPKAENIYNKLTNQALAKIEDIDGIQIARYKTSLYGRAAETLAEFMEKDSKLPSGPCRLSYWLGSEIQNPKAIEIDFDGHVTLCPGICIGNLKTQPLTDVLRDYVPHKHPILSILARDGPMGLAKVVDDLKIYYDHRFVDECHLCYEMRRLLQRHFPLRLAPSSCYLPATSRQTMPIPFLSRCL